MGLIEEIKKEKKRKKLFTALAQCPLTFLNIITPELKCCSSYLVPQSLIIKSRKLDRTVSFNPPVMNDITAADPSQP